jgi:hypothetical protein
LDADQGYTVQQALDVARALEGKLEMLEMLEQPTSPAGFRDGLKVLRDRTGSSNLFNFKNWSPRVGLSYQSPAIRKTVLRASFGRYYTPMGVESFGSGGPDLDRTYSETFLLPGPLGRTRP